MPRPPHPSSFYHPDHIWWRVKIMELLLYQFLNAPNSFITAFEVCYMILAISHPVRYRGVANILHFFSILSSNLVSSYTILFGLSIFWIPSSYICLSLTARSSMLSWSIFILHRPNCVCYKLSVSINGLTSKHVLIFRFLIQSFRVVFLNYKFLFILIGLDSLLCFCLQLIIYRSAQM
jgi:hypothetical protein